MTDNGICGAECVDGSACQHPAGSCPVPTHSDPNAENPQGRPSSFTDELAREAIAAAPEVHSIAGVERRIGVGEKTINGGGGWLDQDLTFVDEVGVERHFSPAFRRARGQGQTELVQDGLYNDEANSSFARYMLRCSYDLNPPEKRETEHMGEGGGPLQIELTETIVETEYDE